VATGASRDAAAAVRAPGTSALDVLIVAFHSGAILERCLAGIATFVPAGSRIVVIDNSPSDASAAEAVARTEAAELLSEPNNLGFAAAVNDGLRRTDAPLVLLVNPDVIALEGSFETIEQIFSDKPDAGAVAVRLSNEDGVLEHCRWRPRPLDFFDSAVGLARYLPPALSARRGPMLDWDHAELRAVDNATGALLVLRRAAIEEVGDLDERFFMYWEETDWLMRARARGWRLYFTPEIRGLHAGRGSSAVDPETHSLLFLESGYRYVRKHFGLATALLLRLAWTVADGARLLRSRGRPSAYRQAVRERLALHLGLRRADVRSREARPTPRSPRGLSGR
jgi:GT2 family glycosyltransferase